MTEPSESHLLREFGSLLRSKRADYGLTQEELAAKAGLDRSYVGGVERGERNISLVNLAKLAVALEMSVGELFEGLEEA